MQGLSDSSYPDITSTLLDFGVRALDKDSGIYKNFVRYNNSKLPNDMEIKHYHDKTKVITPTDPNDKVPPSSFGAKGYVIADQPMSYKINFENVETATAPAQVVTITDQLDDNLDWRTIQFGNVGFGSTNVEVEGGPSFFAKMVDLRPDNNLIVNVQGGINPTSGVIHWTFTSIDPDTGQAPTDAFAGFLPPNDENNSGQGFVTYSIHPKADLVNGTEITNQATIVFDTEEPIDTNETKNIITDNVMMSSVEPLNSPTGNPLIELTWKGELSGR